MKRNINKDTLILHSDQNGRVTLPKCFIESAYPEKTYEVMAYHCPEKKVIIITPASDGIVFSKDDFKKNYPNGKFHYYVPTSDGAIRFRTSTPGIDMKVNITEICDHEVIKVSL